jgi:hypothetical protein
VEWRQAYSTGGMKGDLTAFQKAKVLLTRKFPKQINGKKIVYSPGFVSI